MIEGGELVDSSNCQVGEKKYSKIRKKFGCDPNPIHSSSKISPLDSSRREGDFVYVRVEETSYEKMSLLLYRKGPGANSANYSPVALVTDWEKTFQNKILRWFEWVERQKEYVNPECVAFTKRIHQVLLNHQNKLLPEMMGKKSIPKGDRVSGCC